MEWSENRAEESLKNGNKKDEFNLRDQNSKKEDV